MGRHFQCHEKQNPFDLLKRVFLNILILFNTFSARLSARMKMMMM
ncbi:hypothetical protein D778_00059 [Xanthomarina gelatinilytica]|uniref:Uncharacterized protein n=1 Tax=Xanthomarina gelatinilytica TaxID=1137281 RepID=M7MFP7_9FLAO|nr:hypothetical protein D778_00059 [Xanthomarina gelatinilytica]